jgi:hypothetical protein
MGSTANFVRIKRIIICIFFLSLTVLLFGETAPCRHPVTNFSFDRVKTNLVTAVKSDVTVKSTMTVIQRRDFPGET